MISDQTLSGITEIDEGSKEILESMMYVEEISNKSKEGIEQLEFILTKFKTRSDKDTIVDERGVEVKKPPQDI